MLVIEKTYCIRGSRAELNLCYDRARNQEQKDKDQKYGVERIVRSSIE